MVHALREAHRVLKPTGILIDLRPAHYHRRAGLGQGKFWKQVGVMRESFEHDRAADRAVAQVLKEGLFHRKSSVRLEVDRVMGTSEDFREWLDNFEKSGRMKSGEWLVKRMEQAQTNRSPRAKIVVREQVCLSVLRKQG